MLEERYALGSLRFRGNLFINTPQGRQAAPQTKCSSSVALQGQVTNDFYILSS